MGRIGTTELLIVLAIVLILFGPKALPQLGRSIGRTLGSFRMGMSEEVEEEDVDDGVRRKKMSAQAVKAEGKDA